MKQGIDKSWTRVQTSLFKSYVHRGYFCFVLFIFLLVFSHWAMLIPVLVIIRDLSQVYLKLKLFIFFISWHELGNFLVQFSSVQSLSHVRLCNPMDCSMPGFPVHHQLPELTQTHVHWVSDAIQPSHPLSSPSPPTLNVSQHQGLFQ